MNLDNAEKSDNNPKNELKESMKPDSMSPSVKYPPSRGVSKLVIAIVVTTVAIYLYLVAGWFWIDKTANDWGRELRFYPELSSGMSQSQLKSENFDSDLEPYILNAKETNPILAQRVKEQLVAIRNRAKAHLKALRDLYNWYFLCISATSFTAIIAGFCLVDITRKGWSNSNELVVGIFIATLFFFIFFGVLPLVYQYEKNIELNSNLYLGSVNLEQEVLTKLATFSQFPHSNEDGDINSNQDDYISLEKIVIETNEAMKSNNNVNIIFDSSKIPNLNKVSEMINRVNSENETLP